MGNRIILFKLLLLISPGICLPVHSFAQSGGELADTYSKIDSMKTVNLLYNTSRPKNLTPIFSEVVSGDDLRKMPVSNVYSALAGRLAGLSIAQSSGAPGGDSPRVRFHGQDIIILIDGIPRSITGISLEEIESVTLLKDALATAMLGIRGSKAALLITTKVGSKSGQQISFTAQSAVQKPLGMMKPLNAYNYALLRNEAIANEALIPTNPSYSTLGYSANDLQLFKDGTDPLGHPDVNWQDQIMNPSSKFDKYTLSAAGGDSFARYFVALEHFSQGGLLKTSNLNKYNTNIDLKSYEIRSNVDLTLNSKLTGGIHIFGRVQNYNEPGAGINNILNALTSTPANAYVPLNPNGSYGGNQQFQNNILAQATGSGYLSTYNRDILTDVFLKRTLDEITPGLYVKGLGSFSSNLIETINRSKANAVYQRSVSTSNVETYSNPFGTTTIQSNTNSIPTQGRQSYFELSLGYNHVYNKSHGLDVLVLGNYDNAVSNGSLPYTIQGTSGRVSYNYKEKYLAEVAYGYNGVNRFIGGKTKFEFFPAFGLGWNLSKESFLQDYKWLNYLKLSGTYGKTGNDNVGDFSYIQRFQDGPNAVFGSTGSGITSKQESTLAYTGQSYEIAHNLNIGIDGVLFNNLLSFGVQYYNVKFSGLMMQRGTNTSILGNSYPNENIGKHQYKGWDFNLGLQKSLEQVSYFVSANASIQSSKVLFMDEVNNPYPWMNRTGQPVGLNLGYTAVGLFQSQDEINTGGIGGKPAATFVGYTPQPGDIRYKDLNGDGVINLLDQSPIGPTKPSIIYGVNMGFSFHGFDLSALFQGALNREIYTSGNSYFEFQNGGLGQAYEHHLDRWTPATAATATYPRLSIGSNTNNQQTSTYWFQKADYLRLKNIELGFTVPAKYTQVIKLQSARLFVSGANLLTFTSLKNMDPEVYGSSYPMQKLVNIGVSIKLK